MTVVLARAPGGATGSFLSVDDRCTACGACLWTCPTRALLPAPRRPEIVAARCTGCLECVEVCPRGALTWDERRGPQP